MVYMGNGVLFRFLDMRSVLHLLLFPLSLDQVGCYSGPFFLMSLERFVVFFSVERIIFSYRWFFLCHIL